MSNSFQHYISKISKIPLLTEEQERDLTIQYAKNKTIPLRDKLISHNLRLVVKAAYKYSFTADNVADLYQEGSIGLMIGVDKFDPTRGVRLGTYCYHWIKACMLRYIINNARLVKLGTTKAQRKLFFSLPKAKAKYMAQGIDISDEDLASELGVKSQELREMEQRLFQPMVSLDAPIDNNANVQSRRDFIQRSSVFKTEEVDPSELLEKMELKKNIDELVSKFMKGLSEKNQTVFKRRLVKYDNDTLDSIGVDLHLSRERVRQIEVLLKNKFKRFLKTNQVGDVL